MPFSLNPIGTIHTETADADIPRHWSVSNVRGFIDLDRELAPGLEDMAPGDPIVVVFVFHRSPAFTPDLLKQTPPHKTRPKGVFSICSPVRPNPVGLSVLNVVSVDGSRIVVEGIDMFDGTPVVDIKPHVDPAPDQHGSGTRQAAETPGR